MESRLTSLAVLLVVGCTSRAGFFPSEVATASGGDSAPDDVAGDDAGRGDLARGDLARGDVANGDLAPGDSARGDNGDGLMGDGFIDLQIFNPNWTRINWCLPIDVQRRGLIGSPVTVSLSVVGGVLFTDPSCMSALFPTEITFGPSTTGLLVYFQATVPGSASIAGTAPMFPAANSMLSVYDNFNAPNGFRLVQGLGGGTVDRYYDATVVSDGRIIAVGHTEEPSSGQFRTVISSFRPDGSPDPNFGAGGHSLGAGSGHTVGPIGGASDAAAADDGFLGQTTTVEEFRSVVQDGDGFVAVGSGLVGTSRMTIVARFDLFGQLDTQFGQGGAGRVGYILGRGDPFGGPERFFSYPFESPAAYEEELFSVDVDLAGRIVVGGRAFVQSWGSPNTLVARFLADGSVLDPSFDPSPALGIATPGYAWGNDGLTWTGAAWQAEVHFDAVRDVRADNAGGVVAMGWVYEEPVAMETFIFAARFESTGALNPAFNTNGFVLWPASTTTGGIQQHSYGAHHDFFTNDLYVGGTGFPGGRFLLGKVDGVGNFDGTFAMPNGFYLATAGQMQGGTDEGASDIEVGTDGSVYVLGYSDNVRLFLAKFDPAGALDSMFGIGGVTNFYTGPGCLSRFSGTMGFDDAWGLSRDGQGGLVFSGQTGTSPTDISALIGRVRQSDGALE